MTKKKRRRPSRQQASTKRMSAGIFQGVMRLAKLICLLLELWDLLRHDLWTLYQACARLDESKCSWHALALIDATLFE